MAGFDPPRPPRYSSGDPRTRRSSQRGTNGYAPTSAVHPFERSITDPKERTILQALSWL